MEPESICTILVADDDPTMRDVLEVRLQEWGFQVILAADGRQVAELVARHDPDLVLSDVVMPDMDARGNQ